MQDYQMFAIIGANVAVLMTFMGISISLIIHMNKRIDKSLEEKYTHKGSERKTRRTQKEKEV